MNVFKNARYLLAALSLSLATMVIAPLISFAAQPAVGLGTASSFAVLSGQTVTNTGSTTISGSAGGDIGVSPGSAFTGQASVTQSNGAVHLADGVALQAQNDLITAYNDAAGRTPVTTIATELGGTTLTPGVYNSTSGTFQITGTVTLDAQGDPSAVFIFQTASTLVTASSSSVSLINSALPCKVFWKVGSSATLGTNSQFVGHLFALTSITANTGAVIRGQLLARNGSITLDSNTITNNVCTITPLPAISVSKSADPSALTSGAGSVTYTYTVSNSSTLALNNVSVNDDKIGSLSYVSGDSNTDGLLQPSETWVYVATAYLSETTTNTVTATGRANGMTVTDTASTTVVVTPSTETPADSDSGNGVPTDSNSGNGVTMNGTLPKTGSNNYDILLVGAGLALFGAACCWLAVKKVKGHKRAEK